MAETVEYNLNLDLTLHPIQSILIKQYSKNVYKLIVSVTKETVVYVLNDSLYNVYFKMRTPDNRYVYTQGTIDENGRILLDVPESAAWTAGIGEAEFEIIKKDKSSRMSTCTFEVVIDASSYEEAEITGDNDFSALIDYISQAADISDEVAQAKEYRDEASGFADTASAAAQTATTAKTDIETMEAHVTELEGTATEAAQTATTAKESAETAASNASQSAQSASEDAEATSQALQEAIALYNGPLTAKTAAEMTQTNRIYVYTGSESGYTFGDWYYYNGSTWQSGGTYNATAMDLDDTLTVEGKAADAKAVGDFRNYSTNKFSNLELTDDSIREDVASLKADLDKKSGLTDEAKAALLACFENAAWTGTDGQDYYDALYDALYNDGYPKITVEYNDRGHIVFTSDNIDTLKNYLTVKYFENSSSTGSVVPAAQYTLSGTLSAGTNMIRASYNNTSTTFVVDARGIIVPSEYARKDFVKVNDSYHGENESNGMVDIPIAGSVQATLGKNLNALSFYSQLYVESGILGAAGWALFGGRTISGSESSVALYYSEKLKWLGAHTHGVDTGDYTTPGEIQKDTVTTVSLYNGSASPSTIKAGADSHNIVWENSNNVLANLYLLCNGKSADTKQYIHKSMRVGNIDIKNTDGETVNYLIPSIRTSDNVIGWYDGITGTFYTASTKAYTTIGNSKCAYTVGDW